MSAKWDAVLRALAGRDTPVELSHAQAKPDAPNISYRSRLFEVATDGGMVVECPRQAIHDKAFAVRDEIELVLTQGNERYAATCSVLEVFVHRINEQMQLPCYRLGPARRPRREQRRSFFRVGVAAMDLPLVRLELASQDEQGNRLVDFQIKAQLSNISGGGLGIIVRGTRETLSKIKQTRLFDCYAKIDDQRTIAAPVRVAHIAAIDECRVYLGLSFEVPDEQEKRLLQDRLQQRCTEIQRAELKRRRA